MPFYIFYMIKLNIINPYEIPIGERKSMNMATLNLL